MTTRHSHSTAQPRHPRRSQRQALNVPGRLTWRDARGIPRFATVVTRDVSADGVYLECRGGEPIPLYRLVYLQIERDERDATVLPGALRTPLLSRLSRRSLRAAPGCRQVFTALWSAAA